MSDWSSWICPALVAIMLVGFLLDVVGDFINKIKRRDK